jgi:hypothetical protein
MSRFGMLNSENGAAAPEHSPIGRRFDDDIGDQPGKQDVVGADGEQHEIEIAALPGAPRGREIALQLRDLRRHRARTVLVRRAIELARALRAEHAGLDRRAGTGERQESDGDVRAFYRERQRRADLIAVERAVAGLAHPARAKPRPFRQLARRLRRGLA